MSMRVLHAPTLDLTVVPPLVGAAAFQPMFEHAFLQRPSARYPLEASPAAGVGRVSTTMSETADPPSTDQLESLMSEHLDAVYRVAYSVVRDSALAEDVAQDALLKAWGALHTFRGDSSMRSWLLRITHNTAVSTLRKRREELRDPALLPEQAQRSGTETKVLDTLSIDAFEEALDGLDELSRSIVVLREIEGMSYEEIAETLEVALPTVKTRLLRARRQLSTALAGWAP